MNDNIYKQDYFLSTQRLNKFIAVANSNREQAMKIYMANLKLSESLYSILSIFEVSFRNAIDKQLRNHFNDSDWLINQQTGYMNNNRLASNLRFKNKVHKYKIRKTIQDFQNDGFTRVTQGMILAKQTLGFWIQYFERKHYAAVGGAGALLPVFQNLPPNTTRASIYGKLKNIRSLRNRIAHYEPICFSRGINTIDLTMVKETYDEIYELIEWLDADLLNWTRKVENVKFHIELMELCSKNKNSFSHNLSFNYIKFKHRKNHYFPN